MFNDTGAIVTTESECQHDVAVCLARSCDFNLLDASTGWATGSRCGRELVGADYATIGKALGMSPDHVYRTERAALAKMKRRLALLEAT